MAELQWLLFGILGLYITPSFQQIPLDLYETMSQLTDVHDVIDTMLEATEGHEDDLFIRPGAANPQLVEIIAGRLADADFCAPKVMSVEVPKADDLNVAYYPNCVAVPQCGGCGCGHDMLECAPLAERIKEVEVMKMRYPYPGASKFNYEGLEKIDIVEHTQCACRCKVQPHDCHPTKHQYVEHACQCQCKNSADAVNCPAHQMWSNAECGCVCPKIHWCLEDEYFSNNTCRCEMRSSFVKIVDIEEVTDGPCKGISCRPGYRAVAMGDFCQCRISQVSGVQAGSLGGGSMVPSEDTTARRPSVPEQPARPAPNPAPVRPTRPRRPRPSQGGTPIRQTGSMVPTR